MNPLVTLLSEIGVVEYSDPAGLPYRATMRIQSLIRHYCYKKNQTEERERSGESVQGSRAELQALAMAVRLVLHPSSREWLIEDSKREDA